MKRTILALIVLTVAALPAALAQTWEFGGIGGATFFQPTDVTSAAGVASAGFEHGFSAGAVLGHSMYRYLGGEIRYMFEKSNMKLSGSGLNPTFGAQAHIIHYDFLLHLKPIESAVRPYVAAGGGGKLYRGTGTEAAFQPLNQYAIMTKTQDFRPLISVGAGVKYAIRPNILLRAEFRDYITPFPKKVIAPIPGVKVSDWVHDFVPMFGISVLF